MNYRQSIYKIIEISFFSYSLDLQQKLKITSKNDWLGKILLITFRDWNQSLKINEEPTFLFDCCPNERNRAHTKKCGILKTESALMKICRQQRLFWVRVCIFDVCQLASDCFSNKNCFAKSIFFVVCSIEWERIKSANIVIMSLVYAISRILFHLCI